MAKAVDLQTYPTSTALPPAKDELAAWNRLSRDEQIAGYREILNSADCRSVSRASMTEVLQAARSFSSRRPGG